jgi:hypothetical protein
LRVVRHRSGNEQVFGRDVQLSAAGMMVYRHAETAGRPKSAKARNRGVAAGAAPPALWDFVASSELGVVNSVGRCAGVSYDNASSASSAPASFTSTVSKPPVNQP